MKNKKFEWNKDTIIAIVGICFFVILGIMARVSSPRDTLDEPPVSPTPSPSDSSSEMELALNYHFTYSVEIDNQKEIIDGKVYANKAKFSILTTEKEEYAKLGDSYMRLIDGKYQILDSPLIRDYFFYLDLDSIKEIMGLSLFETGEDDQLIYQVSTPDLLDTYTNVDYDSFSEYPVNRMEVTYTKKGYFKKIKLDYSAYFSYLKGRDTNFILTMEFDDYGRIQDFEI